MKIASDVVIVLKKDISTLCYGFFSTLSNPTRLGIIETLLEEPKHVNQIAAELNQEQSMISHNLRPLVRCHFVEVRREGKQRIYTLNRTTVEPLIKIIEKHYHEFCKDGAACYLQEQTEDN